MTKEFAIVCAISGVLSLILAVALGWSILFGVGIGYLFAAGYGRVAFPGRPGR